MKLVENAHLWHRMWSIRLLLASLFCDVLEGASIYFQYLGDLFPPRLFFGLGMALTVCAGLARIIQQANTR